MQKYYIYQPQKIKHYLLDVSIYSYLLQQWHKTQTNKKSYTEILYGGRLTKVKRLIVQDDINNAED